MIYSLFSHKPFTVLLMLLGYDLQNMKAIESPDFLFQLHIHVYKVKCCTLTNGKGRCNGGEKN
jgi:hypothetical protein